LTLTVPTFIIIIIFILIQFLRRLAATNPEIAQRIENINTDTQKHKTHKTQRERERERERER